MLTTAIKGGIPLIAVHTPDLINAPDVLERLTGKTPIHYAPKVGLASKGTLWYATPGTDLNYEGLYDLLVKAESTMIVLNPAEPDPALFEAGELPVPKQMVVEMLNSVTEDENTSILLMRALGGVTLKEVAELCRLTMARDGGLTAHGLVMTRKTFFAGQPGLALVDTEQGFYEPPDELVEWLQLNKTYFLEGTDRRLVPRGVGFAGPPGVGKTAGAKWAAEFLGVPLYRMDLGAAKNKWQGMSESNNLANLQRLDREEPCCVLFDEVEKIFGSDHNDSGTTATMLAQLLWWLAEHRSRVLTIMTTNNLSALPKELYREGRINKVICFRGLDTSQSPGFAAAVFKTFNYSMKDPKEVLSGLTPIEGTNPPCVSHAQVTEAVYDWIKRHPKKGT